MPGWSGKNGNPAQGMKLAAATRSAPCPFAKSEGCSMSLVMFGARRQCSHVLNLLEWSGKSWQDLVLYDNAFPDIQGPRGLAVSGKVPDGFKFCVEHGRTGLVTIGTHFAAARYEIYRAAKEAGVTLGRVIYDCRIAPSAVLGDNVVMMPGCVISPDVQIGSLVSMFSGVIIEHDCKVGDNVAFGPAVVLSGDVTIEPHCFLGVGSVVKPGVRVGAGCLIGAGAVVASDCPAGWVMAGVPARPLRRVRDGDDAPLLEAVQDRSSLPAPPGD
jgi:sugar O-acyltransferase (sialic acid O-acetyltransferase NeuD family)